jgi:hypothetical protein
MAKYPIPKFVKGQERKFRIKQNSMYDFKKTLIKPQKGYGVYNTILRDDGKLEVWTAKRVK